MHISSIDSKRSTSLASPTNKIMAIDTNEDINKQVISSEINNLWDL